MALDWDLQSDTRSLLCKSSLQTGSVNPEFHCELTTNLAHEILARVILRSGVPWGLVKTLNSSQLSLAMIYDASGCGVPWEKVQMLNIPFFSTSVSGYGVRLGPAKWRMFSVVQIFYANKICESGVPV